MVKHIVLFKLKDSLGTAEKTEIAGCFKAAIEALPERISAIRHIEVGINCNPAEDWDIALESEFDSLADVKTYAAHPAHLEAAAILKDVKAGRACVDYEY